MTPVIEKFLRYVKIDTQSAEDVEQFPSTSKQWNLARLLCEELRGMGVPQVRLDEEHCYVYASIPANISQPCPVIGFISHMDTSPAVTGTNVNPRIVTDYDGKDILLDSESGRSLSPEQFPELLNYRGQDLIVTDGNTLLGADDKAGVSEIMAMAEYLMTHPEFPHGTIKIGFTPDEEVGRGVDFFSVEEFGADYAYTVDGGALGELEYENFNAAYARLTIHGKSIHPGDAKGRMVNAVLLAGEFMAKLPPEETPQNTEGYEGFYHADTIRGSVESVRIDYIIRDHDREKFEQKKENFRRICQEMNAQYGEGTFQAEIKDNYYNMKEMILPHFHLIETAKEAMTRVGVEPKVVPIRGGTDGSRLSYMGLPCPNLSTGGHNFHGRYEYACVQSMEKMVEVLLEIISLYRQKEK